MVDIKQLLEHLDSVEEHGCSGNTDGSPSSLFYPAMDALRKDITALIQDAERWRLVQSCLAPHPWHVGHTVSVPVSGAIVPSSDAPRDTCTSLTKLVDSAIARRKNANLW